MADLGKLLDSVKDKEINVDAGADVVSKVAKKAGKNISADTIKGAADKLSKSIGDKDGKLEVGDLTSVIGAAAKKKK